MSDDDIPASPRTLYSGTPSDRSAADAEAGEILQVLKEVPIQRHNTEVVLHCRCMRV